MKALPNYELIASKLDTETGWPEPSPLPNDLPPVMPFDPELLPQALRAWVTDISHRMQCPPDFSAVGAIVAISSLIGARAVVAPKERDDWLVVPNLWGLIVGRPGVMKSPALAEVLKPLNRLESQERKNAEVALTDWKLDCKLTEIKAKANEASAKKLVAKDSSAARALLEGLEELPKPNQRRYIVTDSTVESLQDMLTTHPWGLMVYRDELHGLLASMDKQGQEQARGFYLQGYDGNQGYTVDRILRGADHHTERVCLAMLGSIQPGKIQSYVRSAVAGGTGDDGLLQRFGLSVWPDVSFEWVKVDQWPDTVSKQSAWSIFERLNKLVDEQQVWRFSPQAQDMYWQWAEPFEREIRSDQLHPALISHLSKYRKLVPALALIFAMVDTPESGNLIHEGELLRALAWAEYLRTHAERMYAAAIIPETLGAKTLLTKIKSCKLLDSDGILMESFTPRLVATKHWMGLADPESVRKASDLLVDYGYLIRETLQSVDVLRRGRPSERYFIHPKLIRGDAA